MGQLRGRLRGDQLFAQAFHAGKKLVHAALDCRQIDRDGADDQAVRQGHRYQPLLGSETAGVGLILDNRERIV
jgi:hypothetical protein